MRDGFGRDCLEAGSTRPDSVVRGGKEERGEGGATIAVCDLRVAHTKKYVAI